MPPRGRGRELARCADAGTHLSPGYQTRSRREVREEPEARPRCFLGLCPFPFLALPLQPLAIRGVNRTTLPFWAVNSAVARCGLRQTSSELTSRDFSPPFIARVNLVTGASGTTSKVLRIPSFLSVSMRPSRSTLIWPLSAATRSGKEWLEGRREPGPSTGLSSSGVVARAKP